MRHNSRTFQGLSRALFLFKAIIKFKQLFFLQKQTLHVIHNWTEVGPGTERRGHHGQLRKSRIFQRLCWTDAKQAQLLSRHSIRVPQSQFYMTFQDCAKS